MHASSRISRLKYLLACLTLPGSLVLASASLLILRSSTPNHIPPLSNSASSADRPFPLEISPDPVSLGILLPGQSTGAKVVLRNSGPQTVTVARIETSCPCLKIEPVSFKIGSGELVNLAIGFDPSHAPDFRGALSIKVTGFSITGEVNFLARVDLKVQERPVENAAWGIGSITTIQR